MPYVEPRGNIQLFKNINLDNRYIHTIYFNNEAEQNEWFASKVFKSFTKQSYSRHTKESIKIAINAEEIIGVTYMRFNNRGNKWFYAFVNYVEYINENTSLISYEIDVMQSWFIQNGTIQPCYVERNHVSDDTFGNYQADEMDAPNETYTSINVDNNALFGGYKLIVETTAQPTNYWRENAFTGVNYQQFSENSSDASNIADHLENMLGSWDKNEQKADVIDMYAFPSSFCNSEISANTYDVNTPIPSNFDYDGVHYTPHNKRLLGYPFSYLVVTNNSGSAEALKWELFNWEDNIPSFRMIGTSIGGGSVMAIPKDYNGLSLNYDSSLVINDFPKRAYSYDAYQAWVASGGQTKTQADWSIAKLAIANGVIETAQTAISGGFSIGQGAYELKEAERHNNTYKGLLNTHSALPSNYQRISEMRDQQIIGGLSKIGIGVNSLVDATQQGISTYATYKEAKNKYDFAFKDAKYHPNYVVGKQNSNLMVGLRALRFTMLNVFPTYQEACRLDELLSIYGYAIKRVTTPTLMCRKYWTFVKTKDCQISGEMPASSKEAIGRIFDGGIFFWRKTATIGKFDAEKEQGTIYNPIQN